MKNLFLNCKWIYGNCKFIFPEVFLKIIISASISSVSVYQALVSKNIIDFALLGNLDELKKYIFIFLIISISFLLINPLTTLLSTYATNKLSNKLQFNVFNHVIHSKYSEQSAYHSMDIVTRVTSDISNITTLIVNTIPDIISMIFLLISSFILLFSINPIYAIISIVLFPIFLTISKIYGKKQKAIYKEVQEKEVKYNSFIQESIVNSMILKTFCREKKALNNLNTLQKDRFNSSLKRTKINIITNLMLAFGMNIGYLIVYAIGALAIGTGAITAGSFTALIQLFQKVQSPVYMLASSFPQIISSIGAAERIQEINKLPLETINKNILDKNSFNEIQFKNVSFAYEKDKEILSDINFNIIRGDSLGIVGGSGQGKTTLLKLILSLAEPNNGSIYVDDDTINPAHRNMISYVPQGNTLLSGTIKENLMYGNKEIKERDLESALEVSCSSEFIEKLPKGIDTIIGEKGIGISEGQAQRISIARAILRKKPILILDEATSALDIDTEFKLLENLNTLSYKPTTIVVTHRPSALNSCNKIIKISNEQIYYQ